MKKFFKKNLWWLVLIFIATLLMFLGTITPYCVLVSCVIFGFICIYFGVKLRKKYKKLEEDPEDANIIDATKLDYDEDVYFIGEDKKSVKKIGKSFLSKISLNSPSIALFLLGFGFFSISIFSFIRALVHF